MTSRSDAKAELMSLPGVMLTPKGVLAGACATYDEGLPADVRAAFDVWMTQGGTKPWVGLVRALLDTREALPTPVTVALTRYCQSAWSAAQTIAAEAEDDGTNTES